MVKNITFLLLMVGAYSLWTSSPIVHGPGVIASEPPLIEHNLWKDTFTHKNYTISPIRRIESSARILSQKRFFFDNKSDISPYDFVIGWGPMSDERNLNEIRVHQKNRTFEIEMLKPALPASEMKNHVALLHAVPANQFIADDLKRARVGHIIHIKGYIVDIKQSQGWMWKSSYDEKEFGRGAEVIWIEELSLR
ncbi:MAG: hypothetical protein ACFCU6_09975 [Balneolaceae bacterium]